MDKTSLKELLASMIDDLQHTSVNAAHALLMAAILNLTRFRQETRLNSRSAVILNLCAPRLTKPSWTTSALRSGCSLHYWGMPQFEFESTE